MSQEMMLDFEKRRHGFTPLALLCALFMLGFALLFSWQSASAFGELEWQGRVEAMPPSGLIGQWTVAGRLFMTDANTDFDTDKGDFAIGRCVELEYVGTAAPFQVTKIATKNGDDCRAAGTPTGTQTPSPSTTPTTPSTTPGGTIPSATPTGDDDDDDHDNDHVEDQRGIINSLPSSGLIGNWTISGIAYEVTRATRLRQDGAPFVVGACVKVEYRTGTTTRLALRIETKRGRECGGQPTPVSTVPPVTTPDPSRTPDANDHSREIFGRVESLPDGLIGTWTIRGQQYTATAETEFDEDHGDFTVGVCIKAHLDRDGVTITEIETSHGFRCGGNDDSGTNARGELYGLIQSFPITLTGDWNIGGITVAADSNTEFNQRNGAFVVGMMVKVKFQVQDDGSFYANEIESKFANVHHDDEHDDHGNDDSHTGRDGHAFGLIKSVPAGQLGIWNISGISYTVNATTTLVPETGDFAVGQRVRVKYYTTSTQERIARQIKLSNEDDGADNDSHATLFGYVEQMPPSGFVGEWIVGGTVFTATGTTKFNEEDGLLGLGAYVKMEYFVLAGVNIVHEIEVAVPPGAGDTNTIGVIDDNGGALQAASVQATTWVIDGVSYTVSPATDLNDLQGALAAGQTVLVNSYAATDGSQVATQIRSITLATKFFLPLLSR